MIFKKKSTEHTISIMHVYWKNTAGTEHGQVPEGNFPLKNGTTWKEIVLDKMMVFQSCNTQVFIDNWVARLEVLDVDMDTSKSVNDKIDIPGVYHIGHNPSWGPLYIVNVV